MKFRIFVLSVLGFFLIWQACDKIDSPYVIATGGTINPGNDVKRTVLIEEFTGQRCPNCPEMAESIKNLAATYPDQVVVVAIHAGFFAMPIGGDFSADYRTPAGNTLNDFFGISSVGYPKALVNRTGYGTPGLRLDADQVAGRLAPLVEEDPEIGITITPVYSASNRTVNIEVDVNIIEAMQRRLMLSVMITEDSIVSPQQNKTEIIHNYVHRHIQRTAVNGAWGDELSDGLAPLNPGTSSKKTFQATLAANWNENHCDVVAFVYDSDTYEVLQAAEIKVK